MLKVAENYLPKLKILSRHTDIQRPRLRPLTRNCPSAMRTLYIVHIPACNMYVCIHVPVIAAMCDLAPVEVK